MSEPVPHVSDQSFGADVLQSETPVLVDFYSTSCFPCKRLVPILEEMAKETDGRLKIVKLDTSESPGITERFGVMAVPTLILFKSGKEAYRRVGVTEKRILDAAIQPLIAPPGDAGTPPGGR